MKNWKIPTWFLGSKTKKIQNINLILKRPPFLSVILIILATLLAGYIFYPRTNKINSIDENNIVVLWIDPSLTSKISRLKENFSPQNESEKINQISHHVYGLRNNFKIKNGIPTLNYQLQYLKNKEEVTHFIQEENEKDPSPFHQSLEKEKVSLLLENEFKEKKPKIIVFSDGRELSLSGLFLLKKYLKEALLIKSLSHNIYETNTQEIIPKDLAQKYDYKIENNLFDFIPYNEINGIIPHSIRPQFILKKYTNKNNDIFFLDQNKLKSNFPAIFACTDVWPSYIEMDSFSAIRELSVFFNSYFLELKCNINNEKKASNEMRKGVLWVVPLNKEILDEMNIHSHLLTPQNFNGNIDTLIYVAPSNLEKEYSLTTSVIQFDSRSFPIEISLSPFPPKNNLFYQYENDKTKYTGKFKLNLTSSNDVPLAWKLSSLPFYYLRTPVSTSNLILSRSHKWIQFWFNILNNVGNKSSHFEAIELNDINKINEEFELKNKISSQLNLNKLVFENPKNFTLGMFTLDNNKKILLTSVFNKNEKLLSEEEFYSKFNGISDKNKDLAEKNEKKILLYWAYFLFCCTLILLWSLQGKKR